MLAVLPGRVRLLPAWCPYVARDGRAHADGRGTLTGGPQKWRLVERWTTRLFFRRKQRWLSDPHRAGAADPGDGEPGRPSSAVCSSSPRASRRGSPTCWRRHASLLGGRPRRPGGPGERRGYQAGLALPTGGGAPQEAPPDWRPTFVDYLFLAYSTATAFSPTDALPLTSRAKLLMMLESSISLATLVARRVASDQHPRQLTMKTAILGQMDVMRMDRRREHGH